jgi:hypothetical protein
LVERIDATLARSSGTIRSCLSELPRQLVELRGKVRGLLETVGALEQALSEAFDPARRRVRSS